MHLKNLKKPKTSGKKNNKDQSRNKWNRIFKVQKVNETKNRFFEKINKTDKPLARLTERVCETKRRMTADPN
jgi:hypothetical protein